MAGASQETKTEDLSIPDLDFYLSPDIFSTSNNQPSDCADSYDIDLDFLSSSNFWESVKESSNSSSLENIKQEKNKEKHPPTSEIFDKTFLKPNSSKKNAKEAPKFCPQCKSKYSENRPLRYFQVSLDHSILLCTTDKCTYPFDTPNETLNIQRESVEELLKSRIDFDINNVLVESSEVEQQLARLQSLVPTFLGAFDGLKKDYDRLESGEYSKCEQNYQEQGSEQLVDFINEAFQSDPLPQEEMPEVKHDVEFKETQETQNIQDMLSVFI